GHTETTDPTALMFSADVVHVIAAGTWLGGLVALAGALRAARSGRVAPDAVALRVARFSTLAAVVSIATAITGITLAWGTVRSFDALTSTDYGRVLLVKVGLVALVVGLAVLNHFWLAPAVRAHEPDARPLLLRAVAVEASSLVAVLLVTASLVNLEPARVAADPGLFEATVPFGDATAVVQVDPARVGENSVHVYLVDEVGRQLTLPEDPTFSFTLEEDDIGPIVRTPLRAGPGHYTLDGPEMSLRGTWTLEIRARVSTFEEATATVEIPVR
ncbi:MAG TPA: CopD family protein, partial [Acidimicrobiales bacterium]